MGHQISAMLTEKGRKLLRIDLKKFTWTEEETGDTIEDGRTILFCVLKRMRPYCHVDVHAELAVIRQVKLADFNYEVDKFLSHMEEKRVDINEKVANA